MWTVHLREGNLLRSKSTHLKVLLIYRNTLTETSRRTSDQISEFCGPAQLTHKNWLSYSPLIYYTTCLFIMFLTCVAPGEGKLVALGQCLFGLLTRPQSLEQCLLHRSNTINIYQINLYHHHLPSSLHPMSDGDFWTKRERHPQSTTPYMSCPSQFSNGKFIIKKYL